MKGAGPDQISNAANQYLRSYGAVRGPVQPKMIRTVSADELEKRLDLQLPSVDRNQSQHKKSREYFLDRSDAINREVSGQSIRLIAKEIN